MSPCVIVTQLSRDIYTHLQDKIYFFSLYQSFSQQDDHLKDLVLELGTDDWKAIADNFQDRTDVQCLHRWQKVLNPELVKGPWTKEVLMIYNLHL